MELLHHGTRSFHDYAEAESRNFPRGGNYASRRRAGNYNRIGYCSFSSDYARKFRAGFSSGIQQQREREMDEKCVVSL